MIRLLILCMGLPIGISIAISLIIYTAGITTANVDPTANFIALSEIRRKSKRDRFNFSMKHPLDP